MPRRLSPRDRSPSIPDDLQQLLADDPRWQAMLTIARRVIGPPPTARPGPVSAVADERTLQAELARQEMTQETLQWLRRQMLAHLRAQYPQIPKSPTWSLLSIVLYDGTDGEPPLWLSLKRWPPRGRKPGTDWELWRRDIRRELRGLRPGEKPPIQRELLVMIHRGEEDTRRVRDCWAALGYADYNAMMEDLRPKA